MKENDDMIRKATINDISRIAEILVFVKRMNYRSIFNDDSVSFGEIQVLPVAEEYSAPETFGSMKLKASLRALSVLLIKKSLSYM